MLKQTAYFQSLSPRFTLLTNQTRQAVGQSVEAMSYKPEVRGFETSGRIVTLRATQPLTEMSKWSKGKFFPLQCGPEGR